MAPARGVQSVALIVAVLTLDTAPPAEAEPGAATPEIAAPGPPTLLWESVGDPARPHGK